MGVFQCIYDTLLREGVVSRKQVHTPESAPSQEQLMMAHDAEYLDGFLSGRLDEKAVRRIGFGEVTRSPDLIQRTLMEVAGTLLTAQLALQHGLACNTAGGTHHAFPDSGSGFCILNDLAVAAHVLLDRGLAHRILILDLDVHQGDGTAVMFQDCPDVFTLSVHGQSNFPARKQRSDLDVGLPDGTGDTDYLRAVAEVLPGILDSFRPDLVMYDAGVDPHTDDDLGRLDLTDDGLYRREMMVLDTCLSRGIPVAGNVGGGYHRCLQTLARRHCLLHRAAAEMWQLYRL